MKNIILIGFMGSGKTSAGISLSYRLRRTMVDTDKEIERLYHMRIPEIFERLGRRIPKDGNRIFGKAAEGIRRENYIHRRRSAHEGR